LTWPQPVEDFPGVWHNKGVRVGFVSADVDRRGVQVVEVDSADNLLGDAGGERDGDPVALTMFGIPGALSGGHDRHHPHRGRRQVADVFQQVYRVCDLRSLHWLMRIGGAVR
jgi:hypothetical protein